MSTAAIILKCLNKKPDDIDLASVDFPGITPERLASTDSDIWCLHRASLLKVEDEVIYLAGVPLGVVSDFPEVADDQVYRALKEKMLLSAAESAAHPDDFDLLQKYVDNKENCAFLVLNALEMVHLKSGLEVMSDNLRQFKLGYMAVMQRFSENFFDDLTSFFSEANAQAAEEFSPAQYAEILLEQIEFFVENRQYQFAEPLFPMIDGLKDSLTDLQMGKLNYLHAAYLFQIPDKNAAAYYEESLKYLANVYPTYETRLINARSFLHLGIIRMREDCFEEAISLLHSALNHMDIIPDDQYIYYMGEKARIYHHLGYLYESIEQYDEAQKYYILTIEIRDKLSNHSLKIAGDCGITLCNLAFLYEVTDCHPDADETFRKSIEIRKWLAYIKPREYLAEYAKIMFSYLYTVRDRVCPEVVADDPYLKGTYDESISIFRYFAEYSDITEWREMLVWLLFDRGLIFYSAENDFANAESYLKEALSLQESLTSNEHSWMEHIADIYFRLGDMFFLKEEYQQAKVHFSNALDYRRKCATQGQIMTTQFKKAECCQSLGEHEQALELYFSSLKMASAMEDSKDKHKKTAYCKACIGEVYFNMEEYFLSRTFYTKAIEIYTVLNEKYPEDATNAESIAACQSWLDDIDNYLIRQRSKSSYLS